jgi:pyridoxine 4-dehydrogenase
MPVSTNANTWTLGDLTVNRIGYGAKRLPGDRDRVAGVLRAAVDLGVNHIDTAAFYPTVGERDLCWANEAIREALAPYPADLVIATKVGPGFDADGTWHVLVRPDRLRDQVEQNLRDLGRDHLDLVNLRQYRLDEVDEHFGVLAEMRAAGMIRHLGLSNVRARHLEQARGIAPVVCVQNRYGVGFGRINDELLAVCGRDGIAFVPFFAVTAANRERGGVAGDETMCWPFPAPATSTISGRTSTPARCACPRRRPPPSTRSPITNRPDQGPPPLE